MRTKALLVDAHAGATGPTVFLERGVWEIVAHSHVQVEISKQMGTMKLLPNVIRIVGPARVSLNVHPKYVGDSVNRQAKQVETC